MALCDAHHGVVHRQGWTATVDDDGTFRVSRPDGTTLTDPPPLRLRPGELPLDQPGEPPPAAPTIDPPTVAPDLTRRMADDDLRRAVATAFARADGAADAEADEQTGRDDPATVAEGAAPWHVTDRDDRGRPIEGVRGAERFTIDWDPLTPAERHQLRELTLRRATRLVA